MTRMPKNGQKFGTEGVLVGDKKKEGLLVEISFNSL